MRPLRIIGYIIEIIIAIALFVVLAQKTPLFDRVIPGRSSGFSSSTTQSSSISTGGTTTTGHITSGTTTTSMTSPLPLVVRNSGKSCTTPWGQQVEDQQSITAYSKKTSDASNTCLSEIRICKQGKLSGSYPYPVCDFFIDGKRNGVDIVAGASNSEQKFGTEAIQLQARLKANKEYIQPKPFQNRTPLAYTDVQGHQMDNSKIPIINTQTTDILEQETMTHDHPTEASGSCITPRGESITHGKAVYAYDIDNSSIHRSCKSETRACINGKLSGTYHYKNCDLGVSQKEKTSDTLQSLAWTENDRLGRQTRIIENNGSTSPGGPTAPRSLHDQINDSILLTQYRTSTRSSKNTGNNSHNIVQNHNKEIHTTNNYYTNNTIPNTIQFSDCTSPWGTTVQHGTYTTAYRNQSVEHNSLCDNEKRFCRNGILGGSYTYQSCTQKAPEIEHRTPTVRERTDNNIKSSGKRIETAAQDARRRTDNNIKSSGKRVETAGQDTQKRFEHIGQEIGNRFAKI